jgi:hydrogenase maturation protease
MKLISLGNELRKDDSIALMISKDLGAIKAFTNPENFINPGEEIIIIDSVDFGAGPGSVKKFKPKEIAELALTTTHNMNIELIGKICKINAVIGIQPKDTGYGIGLSEELKNGKNRIIKEIKELLNK